MSYTIGSAFSGACDGISLGLEWAGLGPTIWQVEYEADRRANLARHWPDADRSVHDIRDATAAVLERPDIFACSAPCQDLSSAGARAGLSGSRSGLWCEAERLIGELRPNWVVVENVASGARNWVPHIRAGLERFGYSCLPIPIAAADVGAPHWRRRVFVLAHADNGGELVESVNAEVAEPPTIARDKHSEHQGWPTELEVVSRPDGISARVVSWLGDSVVPQCAEVVGWVIRELDGKAGAE